MKMLTNCRIFRVSDCPFLKWPICHSGYTGKSGEETWFYCSRLKKYIRHIKKCDIAGNNDKQMAEYKESVSRGRTMT